MAVQKVISYVDRTGVLRTTTVTIDLEKFAIGTDDEQVYLTVTAPGIATTNTWRHNIDKIVENGLYASGVVTRYSLPSNDYGTRFTTGDVALNNVSGVLPQLRAA